MTQTIPLNIHPTAIIDNSARIHASVEIGPYSIIGANVVIGEGCWVGPHVVINGPTTIGKGNKFFQFASIGEQCMDLKYNNEPTTLTIGDNNIFREGCTVHRGTIQDKGQTIIGSNNLIMNCVHIAHDCVVGNNCIFAGFSGIAGHVHVGDGVILGGYAAVHQFCHIGSFAMAGMCSAINKDIPAFVMVTGNLARPAGMNYEGMKRRGYSKELINTLRKAYKMVYRESCPIEKALVKMQDWAETYPEVALFLESIQKSQRGIVR